MGAKGSGILEFTNDLDNESISLHRVFSAVIRYEDSFSAKIPEIGKPGQDFTVEVTSCPGEYNQVSAMLTDQSGTVMAYGRIGDPKKGPKTFKIPVEMPFESYNIIVFGEQINKGKATDYISNLVNGTVSLNPDIKKADEPKVKVHGVKVAAPEGLNITKTRESGELIQTSKNGNIDDIVFTANEGYYFPDDYVNKFDKDDLSGLQVIKYSDTMISITGKMEDDVQITMLPAVSKSFIPFEKSLQDPPVDLFDASEGIGNTTTGMEYSYSLDEPEWLGCDELITKVAPGIWYVRYGETMHLAASEPAIIEVTQIPETFKPGLIHKADGEYVIGSNQPLRFVCEGLIDDCRLIFVDGMELDKVEFTSESGNTIITLSCDYLDALEPGIHQLEVVYDFDDHRVAEFEVIPGNAVLFKGEDSMFEDQTSQKEFIGTLQETEENQVFEPGALMGAIMEDDVTTDDVYDVMDGYMESQEDYVTGEDEENDPDDNVDQVESEVPQKAASTAAYIGMSLLSLVVVSLLKGKKKRDK